jgi:hypothetical protein
MRERGQYQIQLMKTRSSSGVGQKIDLSFDVETLRIFDDGDSTGYTAASSSASNILNKIKTSSTVAPHTDDETYTNGDDVKKVVATVQSSKLTSMLAGLKK